MHTILRGLAALMLALSLAASAEAQVTISATAANAAVDAMTSLIDAGSGPGTITLYGSACPTTADDSDSGTVLAVLTFSSPAFAPAVDGVATADTITGDSSADGTGTAQCARLKDSDGTVVLQGDVGNGASSAFVKLVNTSIVATQPVSISSMTITLPKAP